VVVAGSAPLPWALVPLGASEARANGGGGPGGGGSGLPQGTTVQHFHPDRLGSTMLVTGAGGAVIQHLRYDAYGQVRGRWTAGWVESQPSLREFSFTGYETDSESGLQYAGARFYDPELGMFLSLDPARQFANPYSYTGGNPVNLVDPTGAFVEWVAVLKIVTIAMSVGFAASALNAAIHGASFGMSIRAGVIGGATAAVTAGIASTVLEPVLTPIYNGLVGAYESLGPTAANIAASATLAAPSVGYGLSQGDYTGALALGIGIGILMAGRGGIAQGDARSKYEVVAVDQSIDLDDPAFSEISHVARDASELHNPASIAGNGEYHGGVYERFGEIVSTPAEFFPCSPTGRCSGDFGLVLLHVPDDARLLASWHTHGAPGSPRYELFSPEDILGLNDMGLRHASEGFIGGFLGTPSGAFRFYPSGAISVPAYSDGISIGSIRTR